MAIKEFVIGPQNYFEEDYFSGDYTESNVSRAFLECDIDNIKGGRVVTGEYYEDNYIDGTYFHNNSMAFSLEVEAMVVQEALINATGYYQDSYYESGYFQDSGSRFTMFVKIGETVEALGAFVSEFTATSSVGKLIDVALEFDALFTPGVAATAQLAGTALLELDTDLTSTVSKFTGYESLLEFFAALNAQNDRTRSTDSALGASFDVTSDTARLRDHTASLAVSFDTTASATNTLDGVVSMAGVANITVDAIATRFVEADADLNSAFNASATAISYQLRPDLYARPIDLDSAPYLFDSTLKQYGSHSLRTNFNTLERTQDNAALTPSIGEDCVIEFWFNPDASLLANTEPSFLSYGFFTNRDLVNVNSPGNPSWGFGRTSGTNPRLQFKFWHGNQIYQLLDQTLYTTRIQQNDGWINLAFVRDNNVGRFFVNNAQQSSVNLPSNVTFRTPSVDSRRIYLGGPYTVGASTQGANYDELRIARGTTQRRTWSAPATNDENTVLLHHFDNSGLDDVQFVVDLVETFTAQTQMQVVANTTNAGAALLASGGTLTADITVFSAIAADLESVFTVDADAGLLQFAQANLGALFTPSVETIAINPAETDIVVTTALAADVEKFKGTADLTLGAEFNLGIVPTRIRNIESAFTNVGTLDIDFNALTNYAPRWYSSFNLNFLFQIEPGSSGAEFGDPSLVVINGESTLHPDYPFANLVPLSSDAGAPTRANKPFSIRLLDGQGDDILFVSLGVLESSGSYFERDYQWNVVDGLSWRNQPGVWHRLELSVFQNTATLSINGISLGQPTISRTPDAYFNPSVVNVPSTSFIPWHNLVGAAFAGSGSADNITDVHFNSISSRAQYAQAFFNTVQTSLSADVLRVFLADANLENNTQIAIDGDRIRFADSSMPSVITVDVEAIKTVEALASANITSELNCNIGKLTGYSAQLESDTDIAVDSTRVRLAEVTLNDYFEGNYFDGAYFEPTGAYATLEAEVDRNRNISIDLTATTAFATDGTRIRFAEPDLDSIATVLAVTAKVADFFVNSEVFAQLDAVANKTIDDVYVLEAVSTVDNVAQKIVEAESAQAATVSISIDADKIKEAIIDLESTALADVAAIKTVVAQTSAGSEFIAQITPIRVRFNTVTLNTLSELAIDYDVLFDGEADLGAEFTGVFALGRVRRITETLSAQGFVVTVGDVINIDDYRLLIVPRETRQFKVKQETNTIRVPRETRILIL